MVDGLNRIAENHGIPKKLNSASEKEKLPIMKLTDIHFHNNADITFLKERGQSGYVYILLSVGLLILLVSAMNFINLSLGQSVARSREIGVRKVLGSTTSSLRKQYFLESTTSTFISLIIGMVAAIIYLPYFNQLVRMKLELNFIEDPILLFMIITLGIITSLLSGIYPAYVIASQNMITSLKGKINFKHKWLPSCMIIFQFGISMLLVITSFIMKGQLTHMMSYDLGFSKEYLIYQTFDYSLSPSDMEVKRFADEALKHPGILGISGTRGGLLDRETETLWSVERNGETLSIPSIKIGYDFIPMMGIQLIGGRNFSQSNPADQEGIIVNQAFIDVMQIVDPIGYAVDLGNVKPVIVGVVENFRFNSLRTPVRPLILNLRPGSANTAILIRMDDKQMQSGIDHLKTTWEELKLKQPTFDFRFFEDDLRQQYETEANFKSIIGYASFFAIVTSLFGLIGLTSLSISQRMKEISLRRVLGADVIAVLLLFMKDIGKLLFVSAILFWPLTFFYLEGWLNDFNVRDSQNPLVYLGVVLAITSIAAILILLVVRKTTSENPANVLKSE